MITKLILLTLIYIFFQEEINKAKDLIKDTRCFWWALAAMAIAGATGDVVRLAELLLPLVEGLT